WPASRLNGIKDLPRDRQLAFFVSARVPDADPVPIPRHGKTRVVLERMVVAEEHLGRASNQHQEWLGVLTGLESGAERRLDDPAHGISRSLAGNKDVMLIHRAAPPD